MTNIVEDLDETREKNQTKKIRDIPFCSYSTQMYIYLRVICSSLEKRILTILVPVSSAIRMAQFKIILSFVALITYIYCKTTRPKSPKRASLDDFYEML